MATALPPSICTLGSTIHGLWVINHAGHLQLTKGDFLVHYHIRKPAVTLVGYIFFQKWIARMKLHPYTFHMIYRVHGVIWKNGVVLVILGSPNTCVHIIDCVPARGYFFTYVRTAMGLYFTPTQAYVPILTTYEVRTPVRIRYVRGAYGSAYPCCPFKYSNIQIFKY